MRRMLRDSSGVAEGVETQEQAETLTELGCDAMQGLLFARPCPADQLETALSSLPAVTPERRRTS